MNDIIHAEPVIHPCTYSVFHPAIYYNYHYRCFISLLLLFYYCYFYKTVATDKPFASKITFRCS